MKLVLKSALIGVLSVGILAGCSPSTTETSTEPTQVAVAQPVTQPATQPVTQPATQPVDALEAQLVQATLDNFHTNMPNWEVGLDEEYKTFYIVLKPSEMIVFMDAKEGDRESIEAVNRLHREFDLLSQSISGVLPDYSLALTNPVNKTLHLYITRNGKTLYDFLKD